MLPNKSLFGNMSKFFVNLANLFAISTKLAMKSSVKYKYNCNPAPYKHCHLTLETGQTVNFA